ncbi:TraC family protein [Patescibacteria group bacterium]
MAQTQKIKKQKAPPTQQFLDILEIRDGIVVMKDGTVRSVVLASSINFALKSEEEQNAVMAAYVQFLNTLDFMLQIVIQSRKLNIDEYLDRLKAIEKQQTNELLKMQTAEYRQYISELVELSEIMSKRFYVVIPYAPKKLTTQGFLTRIRDAVSPTSVIHIKQKKFEEYKEEIQKQVGYVIDGLSSIGIKAVQLDTQSLIELFYKTYNPETSDQQELKNINEIRIEK